MSNSNSTQIKCVIVGDVGVGKRCLYTRYCKNTFYEDGMYVSGDAYDSTLNVKVDKADISLHLVVLGGQIECDKIRPLHYPQTDVFLLCFDLTNKTSADNIASKWRPEVHHYCPDMPPVVLVGTKQDLRENALVQQSQVVSSAEGEQLAKMINAVKYIECSSRSGDNVAQVFESVVKAHLTRRKRPKRGEMAICSLA